MTEAADNTRQQSTFYVTQTEYGLKYGQTSDQIRKLLIYKDFLTLYGGEGGIRTGSLMVPLD